MTAWEGLNRRKFPRVNFPCLVTVRQNQETHDVILTHTENIGVGGVCVILKKSLKMFTPTDLEIDLLDGNEHIKCKGKIVWSIRRKSDEPVKPFFYDVGIEFVDIQQHDHARIQKTLQRVLKKNPSAKQLT